MSRVNGMSAEKWFKLSEEARTGILRKLNGHEYHTFLNEQKDQRSKVMADPSLENVVQYQNICLKLLKTKLQGIKLRVDARRCQTQRLPLAEATELWNRLNHCYDDVRIGMINDTVREMLQFVPRETQIEHTDDDQKPMDALTEVMADVQRQIHQRERVFNTLFSVFEILDDAHKRFW